MLSVGRHSSPTRGDTPLAFACDASDSNAARGAACGDRSNSVTHTHQLVRNTFVADSLCIAVPDNRPAADSGAVLRFGRTDLECEREITGQCPTGIRTADAADLLVRRALTCAFATKINKLSRHAEVLSKSSGVSCQSSLHLDNHGADLHR
jgi:hypothetical protein